MEGLDVQGLPSWSAWIWTLHVLGALYLIGFFAAWVRFRRAEARVRGGREGAVAAFNRAISGFPWAFYAKMLGQHAYREDGGPAPGADRAGPPKEGGVRAEEGYQ